MKCKECGAKIPNNKKFCIDCGAWVNPPEERQCIHNNYYEPERYRYTPSVIKDYEQRNSNPSSYKQTAESKNNHSPLNKGVVVLIGIVIAVFIIFIAGTFLLNSVDEYLFNNDFYTDDIIDSGVDNNDGYADAQEILALEYVENYMNDMDYATFDKLTAIDTERIYHDIMGSYIEEHSYSSEEQYYNELESTYGGPVSDIYDSINADLKNFTAEKATYFSDIYGASYSYSVTYSCEMDNDTFYEFYLFELDLLLEANGRKLSDYLPDYENLTDIYDICVDFSDSYNNYYESTWIVVADAGNGPEIVYDDMLIAGIFDTLNG